jgi:GDP-4-dehydro-6-deoxy-D-mannose reductase
MAIWMVTGASGFLGRHVLDALQSGTDRLKPDGNTIVVLGRRCPEGWPETGFVAADLADSTGLRRAIRQVTPDFVIHTAGKTPPALDEELYQTNFWSTMHLLSALGALDKKVRVVLAGSAAELGTVLPSALPVNEAHPCNPRDAYGRSKYLATQAALADRSRLEVLVARIFNPMGPGLPETQAFGRFAASLREPGPDPLPLLVGDLNTRRDFVDVRDVARAMVTLARRGQPRLVYHVGTGHSHRVGDGLDFLRGLSGRTIRVEIDDSLATARGPADSRADISRIVAHTDWRPCISWQQSLTDLWREAAGNGAAVPIGQGTNAEDQSVNHAA